MNEIKKLKDEDYFTSEGVSNSFLIQFDRSPLHAFTERESSSAMELGTMLHKYILQPQVFFSEYQVLPPDIPKDGRLKIFKDYQSEHPGVDFISQDQFNELKTISNNLENYEIFDGIKFSDILWKSEKEVSLFWEEEILGEKIQRKSKIDYYFKDDFFHISGDLKKTQDCRDFQWSVKKYQYFRQVATIQDGIKALTGEKIRVPLISIEMTAPFGIMIYELLDDYIEYGRKQNLLSLCRYINWKNSGSHLTGYREGIHSIDTPYNFKQEILNEGEK